MHPRHSSIESIDSRVSPVRSAAVAFVRGTTFGWSRRELAEWLLCRYSPCLIADATANASAAAIAKPNAAADRLDEENVERIILEARSKILRLLTALTWPSHAKGIAERAIRTGAVVQSGAGFHPVGKEKMLLAERVASLFVADFLEAAEDYRELSLCRGCGLLGFRGASSHDAACERLLRVA